MPHQIAIDHGLTGLLLSALVAYLLGAIPFGLVLTLAAGLGDLRKIGSGNIGTTNVLRTGRKGLAAATLLLDGGKGAVAVLLAIYWLYGVGADMTAATAAADGDAEFADIALAASAGLVAGLFAVLGHMFPVWLGFRGGKGVATGFGVYLALSPTVGLACIGLWLLFALISRYSSAAALFSFLAAPFVFYLVTPFFALMALVVCVLVWIRHHHNIVRLLRGQESRIRLGRSDR
ncbi:MAG: glycerol-3-phosphate 1-O-acyltransferase PlsY [Alphaproteobacteria bacterium]